MEDADWTFTVNLQSSLHKLNMTLGCVKYLTWYHISDVYINRMRECETMASLVCGASNLKCDDYVGVLYIS